MAAKLLFGNGHSNSKLTRWKGLYTFSLPAGHACQFARICRSRVDKVDGRLKVVDGPHTEVRCFGATSEVRSKNLYNRVHENHRMMTEAGIGDRRAMTRLIDRSIPAEARYIRIHATGGDMLSEEYLGAWMDVAELYPEVIFYGYTKAIPYYAAMREKFPENLRLTPSRGGSHDFLIDQHGFHEARIVLHPDEAKRLGWPIDHDDSHAMDADHSFCLLVHGVQPAGGKASEALKLLRKENIQFGYTGKASKD